MMTLVLLILCICCCTYAEQKGLHSNMRRMERSIPRVGSTRSVMFRPDVHDVYRVCEVVCNDIMHLKRLHRHDEFGSEVDMVEIVNMYLGKVEELDHCVQSEDIEFKKDDLRYGQEDADDDKTVASNYDVYRVGVSWGDIEEWYQHFYAEMPRPIDAEVVDVMRVIRKMIPELHQICRKQYIKQYDRTVTSNMDHPAVEYVLVVTSVVTVVMIFLLMV